jgi:hypothetical protein
MVMIPEMGACCSDDGEPGEMAWPILRVVDPLTTPPRPHLQLSPSNCRVLTNDQLA